MTGHSAIDVSLTPWVTDGLHANDAGHARIAEKWIHALAARLGDGCGG